MIINFRHLRLCVGTIALLSVSPSLSALSHAKASLPIADHDFGVIREVDGPVSTRFAVVNDGDKTLHILKASANCGCTTPILSADSAIPGDTIWVDVAYDPADRPGRFRKKVTLEMNTSPRQQSFVITGTVIGSEETLASKYPLRMGDAYLSGRILAFGEVAPTTGRGRYIEGYNGTSDTIRPYVVNRHPEFRVTVTPEVVPPGEQYIYSVVLSSDKHGRWGRQTGTFRAFADTSIPESTEVEVSYVVREQFASMTSEQKMRAPRLGLEQSVVTFPEVLRTAKPQKLKLRISNRGEERLIVRGVDSLDPAVTCKVKNSTLKKGKSGYIEITLDPSKIAKGEDVFDTKIEIITNDPFNSVATVRVAALIR